MTFTSGSTGEVASNLQRTILVQVLQTLHGNWVAGYVERIHVSKMTSVVQLIYC